MDIATTTLPSHLKLTWDPATKEVSFPLGIADHAITCRVPQYVLKRAGDNADTEPLEVASKYFGLFLDVAISKVNRQLIEGDGSVLVRLIDLPYPLEPSQTH